MIITRAPFRVSFFGGSTDYVSFYSSYGSLCLGATIDKYTYVSLRHRPDVFGSQSNISYSKLENTSNHSSISNPLIRESLLKFGLKSAIDLHLFGDMPSRTGLGGSSACCVSLCRSIRSLKGLKISKKILANDAIDIERNILGEAGGIQDQIWAAYGGFNSIEIKKNGKFYVKPIPASVEFCEHLQSSCFLIYTDKQRKSSKIAESHENKRSLDVKKSIAEISREAYKQFCCQNIREVGQLLEETWAQKKRISKYISTDETNRLEGKLSREDVFGKKLLGSGGSGFMLVICDKRKKSSIIKDIQKTNKILNFNIDFEGCKKIFAD